MPRINQANSIIFFLFLFIPACWIELLSAQTGDEHFMLTAFLGIALLALGYLIKFRYFLNELVVKQASFLLVSTALLGLAIYIWNLLFLDYGANTEFDSDIFRGVFYNARAPFYTKIHLTTPSIPLLVVLIGTSVLFLIGFASNREIINNYWTGISAFFMLLMMVFFALTDGFENRLIGEPAYFNGFSEGARFFVSFGDVWRNYTSRMGDIHLAHHYPPGNVLLFKVQEYYIPHFVKIVSLLSAVLTIWPLNLLLKEMALSAKAQKFSIALFASASVLLIYPSFALTIITVPLGACMVLFSLRFAKNKSMINAYYFALSTFLFMMLSYSVAIVGLLSALFLMLCLLKKHVTFSQLIVFFFVSIILIVFFNLLVFWMTGFDQWQCFIHSIENNTEEMAFGFDSIERYFLRSSGNLLAYFGSLGVIISMLSVQALSKYTFNSRNIRELFLLSVWFCALFAGFSGLFFLETERIWVFFTPFFCIVAGLVSERKLLIENKVLLTAFLAIQLSIGLQEEIFIDHSFGFFGSGW